MINICLQVKKHLSIKQQLFKEQQILKNFQNVIFSIIHL